MLAQNQDSPSIMMLNNVFFLCKVHIQLEPDSNKKRKNLDVWTTGSKISKQG